MKIFKVWLVMVVGCLNLNGLSMDEKLSWDKAVEEGDMVKVEEFLAKRMDSDDVSESLVLAAEHGRVEVMKRLLQAGARVNAYGALVRVVGNCDREVVEVLIKAGAEVNVPFVLEVSAWNGCFEDVKLLVGAGAEIDDLTVGAAIVNNHMEMFNFLLKARNEEDVASWLLVKEAYEGNEEEVSKYMEEGVKVKPAALYYAVKEGKVEVVGVLLMSGVDVKKDEKRLLKVVVREGCQSADINKYGEILEMLLSAGVDPNASKGAFSEAVLNNCKVMVKLLKQAKEKS